MRTTRSTAPPMSALETTSTGATQPRPCSVAASSIIARPRKGPKGGAAASASPHTAKSGAERRQVAPAAVQRRLVDALAAVLEDADGDEEPGLDEPVADHEDGHAGQPGMSSRATPQSRTPMCPTVAKATIRLRWRWAAHIDAADERGRQPEGEQDVADRVGVRPQRPRESGPVHARDAVEPELAQRPREDQADRGRRHGIGVGQPEVEGHDRGLDEEAAGDQREGDRHERVGRRPASASPIWARLSAPVRP